MKKKKKLNVKHYYIKWMEERKGSPRVAAWLKFNKHREAFIWFHFHSACPSRARRVSSDFECRKAIAEEKCFINLTFAFDFVEKKKIHFHLENRERVCVCWRKHVKQLRMGDWKQLIFLFAKNYANTARAERKIALEMVGERRKVGSEWLYLISGTGWGTLTLRLTFSRTS